MDYKNTILKGIMNSEKKEEAVIKTLDAMNEKQGKIRIAVAVAAGVGYFVIDSYISKKNDAKLLKELTETVKWDE